jgi:hypothetical protein
MYTPAMPSNAWHVSGSEPLPHLAQQAALEALCGACSGEDLFIDRALFLAWKAAAVALKRCCTVI